MSGQTRLPGFVWLYFFCQSINLMAAVISVAVAASVGNRIAPDSLYATVPYGAQFLFLLFGTYPASMLMKKRGRKFGFFIGATFLALAGIVGYVAVARQDFIFLVASHGLIGLFTACANFYRYAVVDNLPQAMQSRALSLVVAGGVLAGVLGPALSGYLQDIANFPRFSLCYAAFTALALINLSLIAVLPAPPETTTSPQMSQGAPKQNNPRAINFALASIFAAAASYFLMNLFMIQSSLKMDHMHVPFKDSAFAIQWHVVAMFFPSFFTGALIARLGHPLMIAAGFVCFIAGSLINIQAVAYGNIVLSLILLGLGWNFSYVSGSAWLSTSLANGANRQKWQGAGDTVIAAFAAVGAMLPSFLLSGIGWEKSNFFAIAVCVAFLAYLTRLVFKNKEA